MRLPRYWTAPDARYLVKSKPKTSEPSSQDLRPTHVEHSSKNDRFLISNGTTLPQRSHSAEFLHARNESNPGLMCFGYRSPDTKGTWNVGYWH
jgi:hypothetical protein